MIQPAQSAAAAPPPDWPKSRSLAAPPRSVHAVLLATFAIALVLAIRDLPSVLYDDAAITFRFAWRIAHGHGFTFNNGDRTNGSSAPLYTLLLAAFSRLGMDLVTAAKIVGVSCYALSISMVGWLGARLGGFGAAVVAPVLLMTSTQYRHLALSGMESSFALVLGLLMLCLLVVRQDLLAGIVLGLAVVNKLDAGVLAVAIALAYVTLERRPPVRLMGVSLVTALPWVVFSTWYFGSPIPYSATQKATSVTNATYDHDPLWILRGLGSDWTLILLVFATGSLFLIPKLAREHRRSALVLGATVLWGWGHLALFSLLDLGDSYPWYVTVIYPTVSLGAAVACSYLLSLASPSPRPRVVRRAALLALGPIVIIQVFRAAEIARLAQEGHRISPYESFEAARYETGARLANLVEPGDVVQTCFGWIAYQVPHSPVKETCPLSTRLPVGPPTWGTEVLSEDPNYDDMPDGTTVVATITPDDAPNGQRFVVFHFDSVDLTD